MNLIALMQPLSLLKHLRIHIQATCVFFCATSVVQMYFLNIDFIWLVFYSTTYSTCFYSVLIRNYKKLINIYFWIWQKFTYLMKLEKCHYKGKNKIPCKSL